MGTGVGPAAKDVETSIKRPKGRFMATKGTLEDYKLIFERS